MTTRPRLFSPSVLPALLALASCGTSAPPVARRPEAPAPDPDAEIHALNESARTAGTQDTLHGVVVVDPYRTLERESEFTSRWIAAQNQRTEERIQPSTAAIARLDTLLSIGSISRVTLGGEVVFYSRREGEEEQPTLYARSGDEERALLNPSTLGERAAIDWYFPSPDGSKLAYGVSHNGDERSTLRILDVESGEHADESIERTKWTGVAWLPGSDGFYYTRYPKEGEDGFDAERPDNYFPRVFFHALGSDPDRDPLVFGGENGTDFPSPHVSSDGRWLTVNVFRGWNESDVYVLDRGRRGENGIPDARHPLRPVALGEEFMSQGMVHEGKLLIRTNRGAPRFRIAQTNAADPGQPDSWTDVIPEGDAPLDGWAISYEGFVTHYLDDIRSRVYVHGEDGAVLREIALPAPGAVRGLSASPERPQVVFAFESYLDAPSLLRARGEELTTLASVESAFDSTRFMTRQERVASADGTEIPVTLIHARDLEPDGNTPVLLYGYGGFNVSLLPRFRRDALYWLERGGVYAVANLRGGSEFGEEWHLAGTLENKPRVFEDFEAILSWLSTSGLTRPERIAITGGSNGGLLMGAMLTRVPDRFAATASYVGLYDMVRYHRFPPAELWVSEYGSAEDAALFPVLHGYSPYHQVEDGQTYPAALIETADHDGRVHWAHSTKFAAALQEATSGSRPIFFHMEQSQGHGAGTRRSDQVTRYARMFTFFEDELQMRAE